MGSLRMQKPVFERLQNAKHYSVYKKRSLNRNKTDPNTFLSVNDDHTKIDNFFEPPLTKREWWRVMLKETPVPGTYEYTDFLQSSNKRPLYASFKAEPRDKKNLSNSCGEKLLPGAYEYIDFIESLRQKPCTFSFKSSGRKAQLAWERLRTEENRFPVPGQYDTTCPPITKMTVYSSAFRSKTERFKDLFSAKLGLHPDDTIQLILLLSEWRKKASRARLCLRRLDLKLPEQMYPALELMKRIGMIGI